jgi:beta-glucosidase
MIRVNVFFVLVLILSIVIVYPADTPVYQNAGADIEERIEDLLSRMTLEEKIIMLGGDTTHFDSKPNERLGIPALRMTDGPVGVRWEKSTAFPASVCMAATWNPELIFKLGQAIGREVKAKGRNVLLAPCVNIHRVPHGGRNFESFGEDPYLAGRIVVDYIKGVQSEKVIATVKHFACNNQEIERSSIDVKVYERTLHEIYLPAFKAAVQEGGVWAVMSAYNRLNGQYCSSNTWLLTDVLKKQWGFQGLVMSDWGAVHSTIPTLYAGMDIEMPQDRYLSMDKVTEALRERCIKESTINDKVRRMLRAMLHSGFFDQTEADSGACDTPEHRAIARQVAQEGIVLLKNDGNILPVEKNIRSIAVIGPYAAKLSYGGGGSSRVNPFRTVSPLDGLRSNVPAEKNVTIRYEPGSFTEENFTPIPSGFLIAPKGHDKKLGLLGSYFASADFKGEPVFQRIDTLIDFSWGRKSPEGIEKENGFSIIWEGQLRAPETGVYALALGSDDGSRLYINGKLVIDNWGWHMLQYKYATLELSQDKPVDIKIEYNEIWYRADVRLMWQRFKEDPLEKAVQLASSSDMAILFVGNTDNEETEGKDRETLALPADQEELILSVAEANPRTVVVLNCGAGLLMKNWIDKVPAVVLPWFPGQEGGDAIADILYGNVNPSGKLVTTFFRNWEDCAACGNYPGEDGMVQYSEGVFMGYRHFDAKNIDPLFPFGHGLSYSDFQYKDLTISSKKIKQGESVTLYFTLKNRGNRDGAEVVQLYLGDKKATVPRPVKELKKFTKVYLKSGEEKNISLAIDPQDMKFFDINTHEWKAEPGKFNIYIGSSSRDIRLKDSFILE